MFIPGVPRDPNYSFLWGKNRRLRATVIVLDSAGIGVMPKHPLTDRGANTISNAAAYFEAQHPGQFRLPNLQLLGLGNIATIPGVPPVEKPAGAFGALSLDPIVMTDTITGHWGLMGLNTGAYPTYLSGMPADLMDSVEAEVSRRLGSAVSFTKHGGNISGTTVLEVAGVDSREQGRPIVYTSSDSVFQIAFHVGKEVSSKSGAPAGFRVVEEGGKLFVVSEEEVNRMYAVCQACRDIFDESEDWGNKFLRVIARSFATRLQPGSKGEQFVRISSLRRDLTLAVPGETVLDLASESGYFTGGVGKFYDIFSGKGIQRSWPDPAEHRHLKSDMEGIDFTIAALKEPTSGIIGVNLVDLDERYGHRNDAEGYARNLMAIDARLPEIFASMGDHDLVMITADHGNDPTRGLTKLWMEKNGLDPEIFKKRGTNHTREFVPLLVFGTPVNKGENLGIAAMADVGATIADYLGLLKLPPAGESFLDRTFDAFPADD